jgi:hypothetical protein
MKLSFLLLLNFVATWTLAVPIRQTSDDGDGQNSLIAVVTGQPFYAKETKKHFLTTNQSKN